MKQSVALIGFMGSGKTTVGPLLADLLEVPFVDLDAVMVERAGMSVKEVFAAEGEEGWRRREREVLAELSSGRPLVLGCGGGIILSEANRRELMARFTIVYLLASTDTLAERLISVPDRPLLDVPEPKKEIERLYAERLPVYEAVADISVATDARAPNEIAVEISDRLGDTEGGAS